MIDVIGEFLGGLVAANAAEWAIHRYVLHGLGRRRGSFWAFHWYDHHRTCRKNDFVDDAYLKTSFSPKTARGKETLSLLVLAVLISPLTVLSVPFVVGLWLSMVSYYVVHKVGHVRPEWARKWLKHHYEHHMCGNQSHSWCVTIPFFDWLMRTRWKDQTSVHQ